MKHSHSKILEFKSTKDTIKVLGSFLSYNQNKNVEENFMKRIRKMKTKVNLWLSRDMLYGKSLLAKTLGVSQLIYAASMLSVPTPVIKNVQAELFNFLWKNKETCITLLMPLSINSFLRCTVKVKIRFFCAMSKGQTK